MLRNFSEEDFEVLRGPFESGRQNPRSLAFALVLFIFIQPLMFFLTYVVAADDTFFPGKEIIFKVHLVITIILTLMSIIYAIPLVYKKSGRIQYFVVILVSQNVGAACFYISSLFLVGGLGNVSKDSLLTFTYVTLLFGVLIFVITWIRFYILMKKGDYRKGSSKDRIRNRFETKSYLPMAIIGGIGIVYIIQYIARNSYVFDVNIMLVITIGPLLLFAMLFVLPEQLVILYCKYRFDSFNYDENGELKPMGSDRKDVVK